MMTSSSAGKRDYIFRRVDYLEHTFYVKWDISTCYSDICALLNKQVKKVKQSTCIAPCMAYKQL